MSKELFWLVATVIMTGLIWLPYILDRVLVRGLKGSRAPLSLCQGLVLAGHDGTPTPEAEAVLRRGGALPFGEF